MVFVSLDEAVRFMLRDSLIRVYSHKVVDSPDLYGVCNNFFVVKRVARLYLSSVDLKVYDDVYNKIMVGKDVCL